MSTAAAVILFAAVTVYAIFGGADFGAGFWDLIAGGAKRGERPREVIDHSIAPVWEANHVWLIFIFVVLWTCFPEAYASITLTLFVPLTLAALGIVLRGASFAFRKAVFRTRDQRNFGAAFALSSVLVPFCLGAVVGSIASGRVPSGGEAGDPWSSWLNPTSIIVGLLAVCLAAYLAAFFLVSDAQRLSDDAMVAYFRRRASAAAVVAGVVAVVGIFVLSNDATYLFDGLTYPGAAAGHPVRRQRCRCALPARPRGDDAAPGSPPWSPSAAWSSPGAWPSGTTCCPRPSPSPRLPHRPGTMQAVFVATGARSRADRAVVRPALRARPEDPPARGEHARARHEPAAWSA